VGDHASKSFDLPSSSILPEGLLSFDGVSLHWLGQVYSNGLSLVAECPIKSDESRRCTWLLGQWLIKFNWEPARSSLAKPWVQDWEAEEDLWRRPWAIYHYRDKFYHLEKSSSNWKLGRRPENHMHELHYAQLSVSNQHFKLLWSPKGPHQGDQHESSAVWCQGDD